jgi:hypothetical protein
MLINEKDAIERLASPLNLMNRLAATRLNNGSNKRNSAMSLFVPPKNEQKEETQEIVKVPKFFDNPFEKAGDGPAQETAKSEESNPSTQPQVENLIENADAQIKLAQAHDLALDTLTNAVRMIGTKLDDVKPDKLPSVIAATSKVVESIRKERNEANKAKNGNREVHLHFYTPVQKQESDYEVIDVN